MSGSVSLAGRSSIVIGFGFSADRERPPQSGQEIITLDQDWKLRPIQQYRVGDSNYEIKDLSSAPAKSTKLGDWKSSLGEYFSNEREIRVVY